MEDLQKTFYRLGLTDIEAKIYYAALQLGTTLPKHLAEKAGVKRPTLYKALPQLLEKGLLSETIIGKRRYLIAEDPEAFIEQKREDITLLEKELPLLRTLISTATIKPKIQVHEGVEGVKKIYANILKTKTQPALNFMNLERIHPNIEKYVAEYFIPERVRRKIKLNILLSGSTKHGKIHLPSDPREYRDIRIVNAQQFPFPLDGFIHDASISFAVYREDSEPIGIIIQSQEISTAMRSLFNLAWQHSAKPD